METKANPKANKYEKWCELIGKLLRFGEMNVCIGSNNGRGEIYFDYFDSLTLKIVIITHNSSIWVVFFCSTLVIPPTIAPMSNGGDSDSRSDK